MSKRHAACWALALSLGCGSASTASGPVARASSTLDGDSDGLVDVADMCPCEPETQDGWQDEDGCPDLDDDADRYVDVCDLCPREAEVWNGIEDEDGCPDRSTCYYSYVPVEVLDVVSFADGSDVVPAQAHELLAAIVVLLQNNPQVTQVVIHGHADDGEPDPAALAQRRAIAVRAALTARGVDGALVIAMGHADDQPLVPAESTARVHDRRVAFELVQPPAESPPILDLTVPLVCPDGPPPEPGPVC